MEKDINKLLLVLELDGEYSEATLKQTRIILNMVSTWIKYYEEGIASKQELTQLIHVTRMWLGEIVKVELIKNTKIDHKKVASTMIKWMNSTRKFYDEQIKTQKKYKN